MRGYNLERLSGLPMNLDQNGNLLLAPEILVEERKTRTLDELTSVYLDKDACRGKEGAYEMINGVVHHSDVDSISTLPLRYELTLFPEKLIGKEYVKTLGHLHTTDKESGIDPPEICEVLKGRAHFMFMKFQDDGQDISKVFYVELLAGEKIIIPPGYDHLTINPGPGPLLFSDVVARTVSGNYQRMIEANGAVYLEVFDHGKQQFIPNPYYRYHPTLLKYRPREFPELGLVKTVPLYTEFVKTLGEKWRFLWNPKEFQTRFPELGSIFYIDEIR